MNQTTKIIFTLSDLNLNDSRIKEHLLKFRSGTGIQERTSEIKRLLLFAIDHHSGNVPVVSPKPFSVLPPAVHVTSVEKVQDLLLGHDQSTLKTVTEAAASASADASRHSETLDSINSLYSQANLPSPLN